MNKLRKVALLGLGKALTMHDLKRIVVRKMHKAGTFTFNGIELPYFFHSYDNFPVTERSIEIPIIRHYAAKLVHVNVLEIGNVTDHYHDSFRLSFLYKWIVDKHEIAPGVMNEDILEYQPPVKFDFIFSISTFERMGTFVAINSHIHHVCNRLLAPDGTFIITAPLGREAEWDRLFATYAEAEATRSYTFKRTGDVTWEQIEWSPKIRTEAKRIFIKTGRVYYLSILEFRKKAREVNDASTNAE